MFDLNLYRVFDAIYAEGSLTRAGAVLHRSQPALSYSLARLREHFDDELFVRHGNRLMPTPLARQIVGPVREALSSLSTVAGASARFDAAADRAAFRVALRDLLESTLLPPLVEQLHRQAPKVTLSTARVPRDDIPTRLAAGTLDLALDVRFNAGASVRHRLLRRDGFVVAGRRALVRQLNLQAYLAATHALVSSREEGPGVEDFGLRRLGHQRQIVLRCQTYFAACVAASRSDLLVTLPAASAQQLIRRLPGLACVPLPADVPPVETVLYWHQRVDVDPANRWLRERLAEAMAATD